MAQSSKRTVFSNKRDIDIYTGGKPFKVNIKELNEHIRTSSKVYLDACHLEKVEEFNDLTKVVLIVSKEVDFEKIRTVRGGASVSIKVRISNLKPNFFSGLNIKRLEFEPYTASFIDLNVLKALNGVEALVFKGGYKFNICGSLSEVAGLFAGLKVLEFHEDPDRIGDDPLKDILSLCKRLDTFVFNGRESQFGVVFSNVKCLDLVVTGKKKLLSSAVFEEYFLKSLHGSVNANCINITASLSDVRDDLVKQFIYKSLLEINPCRPGFEECFEALRKKKVVWTFILVTNYLKIKFPLDIIRYKILDFLW